MAAAGDGLHDTVTRGGRPEARTSHDRALPAVFGVCFLLSVPVALHTVHGHAILPALDLALDTTATVILIALTTLAWARFRERNVIAAACHSGAFVALSTAYGVAVVVSVLNAPDLGGRAALDAAQPYVFALAQLTAAILFVLAGVITRRPTSAWNPAWILVAPALGVVLVAILGRLFVPPDGLLLVTFTDPTGLPDTTLFGTALEVATAALYFAGASASRGLWRSGGAVIDSWISIGLVFAGFAELQAAFYPSGHPGQVSLADMLRLMCSLCLLAGLASAFRADQRGLRTANVELARLRENDLESAAIEERSRLARELHDGLAQDLWLAKLRTGEVASFESLPLEAQRAAENALAAIDVALAHYPVKPWPPCAACRRPGPVSTICCGVPSRSTRTGSACASSSPSRATRGHVAPRTQVEILRVVQEALANVTRHADATVTGVRLVLDEDRIELRVADNGHGFTVGSTDGRGYGLSSMRERAALIDGRLGIESSPEAGTLITLTAPFSRSARLAAAEQA